MITLGNPSTRQLFRIPAGLGPDAQKAYIKAAFKDIDPDTAVPFVDAPRPASEPGFIWIPGEDWQDHQVIRTWTKREADPEPVPASVTRAQLKLALIDAGLYQRTVDFVNDRTKFPDADTWKKVQVNWVDRLTFERQHPVTLLLMQALGVSSEQADALWVAASKL